MNLKLVRGARPYGAPWQAIAAAAVLVGLGIVVAAQPVLEEGPVVCPFRAATGLPCPTCGLLRTAHHLLGGRIGAAFAVNPLDAVSLLVVAPALLLLWIANATRGVALRVTLSPGQRRCAWAALGIVVALNWIYVLVAQR